MGLQFRRSIKIASGIRVNFGKKSTNVSDEMTFNDWFNIVYKYLDKEERK